MIHACLEKGEKGRSIQPCRKKRQSGRDPSEKKHNEGVQGHRSPLGVHQVRLRMLSWEKIEATETARRSGKTSLAGKAAVGRMRPAIVMTVKSAQSEKLEVGLHPEGIEVYIQDASQAEGFIQSFSSGKVEERRKRNACKKNVERGPNEIPGKTGGGND